ncbi:MAG: AraC family transcriptional regulator [Tannerellaceae bacterium]|jgi:AraC-like DNA-binding protein|nr:AraC family transcriptional regulator [Tannerellaceae bacterium]
MANNGYILIDMNNDQATVKKPLSLRIFSLAQSTGFKCHEVKEDCVFSLENKDDNHILFLLEGKLKFSLNNFVNRKINSKEFVFIPIAADVKCKTLEYSRIILFTVDNPMAYFDKEYTNSLLERCSQCEQSFIKLPFYEPVENFVNHLILYAGHKINWKLLQEIKEMELLTVLKSFYRKEEISNFFYPVIGKSPHFRMQVLRNYRQESHVDGLAQRIGIEKRSFSFQFKEEFNMSPYQWLLNQKAKHIHFSLAESDKTLDEIRAEFGFKFAGHFTRFCKKQFNCTPVRLRRQLAYES